MTEDTEEKHHALWDRLSRNMIKAKAVLEDLAKKSGLTLSDINIEPQDIRKRRELQRESTDHPAAVMSRNYEEAARVWLRTQPGMLDKLESMKNDLTLGLESEHTAHEYVAKIKDSLAVIQWYSTLIYTKLVRALMGRHNDVFTEDDSQNDANGSAKVALIGIERSMQAWIEIFHILPEQEDHFLKILSMLEQLKGLVTQEFPHAMDFVRPGFDELLA